MSQPKKILVVDDDIKMHEFYTELFASHSVTFCTNGEDAVALIEQGLAFQLIYLDIDLLGMSGLATLDKIKEIAGDTLPPVVVSSNLSDPETRKTALEKGAAGFVPKPINLQYAIRVAHKLLNGEAAPPAA